VLFRFCQSGKKSREAGYAPLPYPNGDKVANINIAFLCEDFSGEMIADSGEVTVLKWFPLESLPENISPPSIPAFRKCVEMLKERAAKH